MLVSVCATQRVHIWVRYYYAYTHTHVFIRIYARLKTMERVDEVQTHRSGIYDPCKSKTTSLYITICIRDV